MKIYHFDTVLTEGKFKDNEKTVREAFDNDKKIIFKLIKKYGYSFDDEVLAAAHITKMTHEHTLTNVIADHDRPKTPAKKLKKDKKSIDEILDEIDDDHNNIKDDFDLCPMPEDIDNVEMPIDPEI